MATICQIGCGMIGKVMALDISKRHDLHLSDLDSSALKEVKTLDPSIKTKCFNVNDYGMLKSFLKPADIVYLLSQAIWDINCQIIIGSKKIYLFFS